jgi:hypothetical protein
MTEFIVTQFEGSWAVTYFGFILSRQSSTSHAIKAAVEAAAAEAKKSGEQVRVMVEDGSSRRVVWDSRCDSFSK